MPRPVIPDYADRHTCRALGCKKEATQACSRCKGGSRNSYYCSRECQNDDWVFHKQFCGKKVYTFKIELLGSQDPVITRIVDVPAWYTFEELHFVVQYAFGPWQQCHLHEFSYRTTKSNRTGTISLKPLGEILRIVMADDEDDGFSFPGLPGLPSVPKIFEKNVKLKDIYDPSGRLREKVLDGDGHVLPLTYVYDFGDNWEHRITFKGEKMASAARPLFISATGYPPAEDAGGVTGWEEVKEAFAAQNPTQEQLEKRQWATDRMTYLEDKTDPLSVGNLPYSPFNEVNVTVMNYEGRWENHLEGYRGH